MEQISRLGMDTSKHVFQLHGVNAANVTVLRKKLRRKDSSTASCQLRGSHDGAASWWPALRRQARRFQVVRRPLPSGVWRR